MMNRLRGRLSSGLALYLGVGALLLQCPVCSGHGLPSGIVEREETVLALFLMGGGSCSGYGLARSFASLLGGGTMGVGIWDESGVCSSQTIGIQSPDMAIV